MSKPVFITIHDGVATIDESTLPDGLDIRILDFDAMESHPHTFDQELDATEREYLFARHSTRLLDLKDMLSELDDDEDDEDDDEDDEDDDEKSHDFQEHEDEDEDDE